MRNRLNAFNTRNTHLWYSWLQAKRSALPASIEMINVTYRKHWKALSSPDKGKTEVIERIFENPHFTKVLEQVRRRVTKVLKASSGFTTRMPSKSASLEKSRAQGGAQGHLFELVEPFETAYLDLPRELYRMRDDPLVVDPRTGEVTANAVSETFIEINARSENWEVLKQHLSDWDLNRPLDCYIQGIVEPLKVRTISKGPALPYYSQKPLQKAMHSVLRKMPCFKLIGQTFDPTMLVELAEKAQPDWKWMSVDYSGATDELSWTYSGRILQYIIGDLDPVEQLRALRVLGPHNLIYPCLGEDGEPIGGLQGNGQLMGSPLSFPILCLANLGVYLDVMTDFEMDWTTDQLLSHVLINGDDMVYAAPDAAWDKHVGVGHAVGLKMSPGKAYIHETYLNINSVSVHYPLRKGATPKQINFLNTGLYFGRHKVMETTAPKKSRRSKNEKKSKEEVGPEPNAKSKRRLIEGTLTAEDAALVGTPREEPEGPEQGPFQEQMSWKEVTRLIAQSRLNPESKGENLFSVINQVLDGARPGTQCEVLKGFIALHREVLQRECEVIVPCGKNFILFERNWFLPISAGGMGVNPPPGWKFKITGRQRLLALASLKRSGIPVTSPMGPSPGYPLEQLEVVKVQPWTVQEVEEWALPVSKRDLRSKRAQINSLQKQFGSPTRGYQFWYQNKNTRRGQQSIGRKLVVKLRDRLKLEEFLQPDPIIELIEEIFE